MYPSRWFKTMDPLVDKWRERYYPEVKDWNVYDSAAFDARPDMFETISAIMGASPRLSAWINRTPALLDILQDREFTDLDLPDGFGPSPEFELIARRGLTRVYWTLEFTAAEMKEQVADIPVQDTKDAVEIMRNWSNDKVLQVAMHTLRGNLSPVEAGTALSNIAEGLDRRRALGRGGGFHPAAPRRRVGGSGSGRDRKRRSDTRAPGLTSCSCMTAAAHPIITGPCASAFLMRCGRCPGTTCCCQPMPPVGGTQRIRSVLWQTFRNTITAAAQPANCWNLRGARCVFTSGDAGLGKRFEDTRLEILANGAARDALLNELRRAGEG